MPFEIHSIMQQHNICIYSRHIFPNNLLYTTQYQCHASNHHAELFNEWWQGHYVLCMYLMASLWKIFSLWLLESVNVDTGAGSKLHILLYSNKAVTAAEAHCGQGSKQCFGDNRLQMLKVTFLRSPFWKKLLRNTLEPYTFFKLK